MDLFLLGGLLLFLVTGFLFIRDRAYDVDGIRGKVEQQLQADFLSYLEREVKQSRLLAKNYRRDFDLGTGREVLRLALDEDCDLVQWSNSEILPSTRFLQDLCTYPEKRTLQDLNKVYYFFRHQIPGYTIATLIPIEIGYTVDNSFLPREMR